MTLFLIITACVYGNLIWAGYHAYLWQHGRPIKHGWWGLLYVAIAVAVSYGWHNCNLFLILCFVRQLVFDNAYDRLRGFSITYHSTTTTSIIDKIEYFVFRGNWYLETITYTAGLVLCLVFNNRILQWQETW